MNRIYPKALDAIGTALVDLESVTLKLMLLDDSYTFDEADDFLDDVASGARISAGTALAGTRTMSGGVLTTDTPLTTLGTVAPNVDDVAALVLYVDAGSDATRRLVAYWTNQADTTVIAVVTDGGDVEITFPAGRLLRI
jgi:hypothetical protein